jgi:hypothetical protein
MIFFLWSLFSLHIPISYDRIRPTPTSSIRCTAPLNVAAIFIIIDGFFFALYNGIIVPIILIIFGLLIFRNVKILHRRILPLPISTTTSTIHNQINTRLTRGNQHLITMLLFQVSLTIILYIPFIVLYLYGIYNSTPDDLLALLFYEIFAYIANWFWFMNYCKAFYINILSSKTFRNILKRKISQFIFPGNHQNLPHRSIPAIIPHPSHSSSNSDSELSTATRNNLAVT